jgi:hypothetical protein
VAIDFGLTFAEAVEVGAVEDGDFFHNKPDPISLRYWAPSK